MFFDGGGSMKSFLDLMMEATVGRWYAIRIDPKVTTTDIIGDHLNELDKSIEISSTSDDNTIWARTTLPKDQLSAITGVDYVVESEPNY